MEKELNEELEREENRRFVSNDEDDFFDELLEDLESHFKILEEWNEYDRKELEEREYEKQQNQDLYSNDDKIALEITKYILECNSPNEIKLFLLEDINRSIDEWFEVMELEYAIGEIDEMPIVENKKSLTKDIRSYVNMINNAILCDIENATVNQFR